MARNAFGRVSQLPMKTAANFARCIEKCRMNNPFPFSTFKKASLEALRIGARMTLREKIDWLEEAKNSACVCKNPDGNPVFRWIHGFAS